MREYNSLVTVDSKRRIGKKQDKIFAQLTAAIAAMQNPKSNEAQNYLTQDAIAGAEWLKKGDFSSLPKGQFFDFQMPQQQLDQYKKFANVNQGGTFALGDTGGRSAATSLQGKFLKDKFARDAGQNYQNNISGAAGNIRGALGQAAGAKGQTDANVISALQGLFGSPALNKPSQLGSILGMVGQLGGSAMQATGW